MLTIVTNKQQLYEGRLVHHKNRLQPIKGNDTYCNLTVSKELHANFHNDFLSYICRGKKSHALIRRGLPCVGPLGRLLVLKMRIKIFFTLFSQTLCVAKTAKIPRLQAENYLVF